MIGYNPSVPEDDPDLVFLWIVIVIFVVVLAGMIGYLLHDAVMG